MKKAIYCLSIFSLLTLSVMPVAASTGNTESADFNNISTSLTRDTSGGIVPIVKAMWESNADRYTDASSNTGAQIMPSGQHQVNKTISICAVVTDPDGLADIDNVYADVFYPVGIALGDSHVALPNQSGKGCGEFMQEDTLKRLEKTEGYNLFCGDIRNKNNNLPTFNEGHDYDNICAMDGELMKDKAAVYCGVKDLSYEDPSGSYKIWAIAQDKTGQQGILENHFDYVPLTAFETDFTNVQYGTVKLNTHKIVSGDLTWNELNSGPATVRNVGNTRLAIRMLQDDMGFGMTDGKWNVRYNARIGSLAPYSVFHPETKVRLSDELDLSEKDEIDFSVEVSKFPPTHEGDLYTGNITLSAVSVPHLVCDEAPCVVDDSTTASCDDSVTGCDDAVVSCEETQ